MTQEELDAWIRGEIESITFEAPAGGKPIIKIKYFKEHGKNKHDAKG